MPNIQQLTQQSMQKRVQRAIERYLEDNDFQIILGYLITSAGVERSDIKDPLYIEGRRSMGLELMRICDSIATPTDDFYGLRKRHEAMVLYKQFEKMDYDIILGKGEK